MKNKTAIKLLQNTLKGLLGLLNNHSYIGFLSFNKENKDNVHPYGSKNKDKRYVFKRNRQRWILRFFCYHGLSKEN